VSLIIPGSSVGTSGTSPPEQVQSVAMAGKMYDHEDHPRLLSGGSTVSLFSAKLFGSFPCPPPFFSFCSTPYNCPAVPEAPWVPPHHHFSPVKRQQVLLSARGLHLDMALGSAISLCFSPRHWGFPPEGRGGGKGCAVF